MSFFQRSAPLTTTAAVALTNISHLNTVIISNGSGSLTHTLPVPDQPGSILIYLKTAQTVIIAKSAALTAASARRLIGAANANAAQGSCAGAIGNYFTVFTDGVDWYIQQGFGTVTIS